MAYDFLVKHSCYYDQYGSKLVFNKYYRTPAPPFEGLIVDIVNIAQTEAIKTVPIRLVDIIWLENKGQYFAITAAEHFDKKAKEDVIKEFQSRKWVLDEDTKLDRFRENWRVWKEDRLEILRNAQKETED